MAGPPPDRAHDIDAILDVIATGGYLNHACPARNIPVSTFCYWVTESQELAERYARASLIGADVRFERLQQKAEEAEARVEGCENPKLANALVQAIRLQVDTQKWAIARTNARKYGDKLDLLSGGEKLRPAVIMLPPEEGGG